MAGKGINKPLEVSEDLFEIVKKTKMSRAEVMKKVWAYIKKHDLQDEQDKRMINPDELLGRVIGNRQISMFKMTAKISEHLF